MLSKQEQNTDEDVNSSNTSLRRKLFFNHDNDNDSIASFSSVEMSGSMVLSSSPPQSGMFIHGSLKVCRKTSSPYIMCIFQYCNMFQGSVKCRRHSFRSVSLSPPYMSPIRNEDGTLCEKIRRRSRSITQLDLVMDMSIDLVGTENYQNSCNGDLSGKCLYCISVLIFTCTKKLKRGKVKYTDYTCSLVYVN